MFMPLGSGVWYVEDVKWVEVCVESRATLLESPWRGKKILFKVECAGSFLPGWKEGGGRGDEETAITAGLGPDHGVEGPMNNGGGVTRFGLG